MDECICLKGVTFDRKYFHSATLIRGNDPGQEKYFGNLTLAINFLVPFVGGQAILKTMFLKETTPVGTIDLYLYLLRALVRDTPTQLPNRDELIAEHLTADEKALSSQVEQRPPQTAPALKADSPPSALEATEEDAK